MKSYQRIVVLVAIMVLISTLFLVILGYRITVDDHARPDWEAIAAIGAWTIPVIVIYVQIEYENRQRKQEKFNTDLLNQIALFIEEHKQEVEAMSRLYKGIDTLILNGGDSSEHLKKGSTILTGGSSSES